VVDLLAPYAKGGKIGLFGGAGVGKTVGGPQFLCRFMWVDHAVSLSFGRVNWVFGKFEVVIMELIHNIAWTSAMVGALSLKK